MVIWYLKQIGKLKKLDKWAPHELTTNKKKNCCFEVSLDSDVKQEVDCVHQPETTSSVAGPRRSSKALPKAKLAPKKHHGHCSVVCWPDPLQLSESRRNHYI